MRGRKKKKERDRQTDRAKDNSLRGSCYSIVQHL